MDNGAHFYRCDFQVHSPRDIGWKGGDAVTETERKAYSEELISACRKAGLHAIAITDHHDLAFFSYIKQAAATEVDDENNPVPKEKQIVVFPGVELTLTAPNCQALLLLDADFPEDLLLTVLSSLSISPSPVTDSKTAPVQRIPTSVVNDLPHLYEKLNSVQHIQNRFIVFPNVSEGGSSTMLRSGFANFYNSMPCVGGYVDGSVNQFGDGNKKIVAGKNKEYGFKAIGVVQTSDNRKKDHSDLGKHTSWIKWSEPTAEALRQACLAKESRVSNVQPELPLVWITSLKVSNSKFMSRVDLEWSQQYNAIIGGRGTGKSTLLEYLRWALCDQPATGEDPELGPVQLKRKKLIEDTLVPLDAEVVSTFLVNGVNHIVKRNSKTNDIQLRIGDGEFTKASEEQIRAILPIQAYSQKQLSSIGIRVDELKRFVELPVKRLFNEIKTEIKDTEAKIRITYNNLIRKRHSDNEVNQLDKEIESLDKQLEALRKSLVGLSDENLKTIGQKQNYDLENSIVGEFQKELKRRKDLIVELKQSFEKGTNVGSSEVKALNQGLIDEIKKEFIAKRTESDANIDSLEKIFHKEGLQSFDDRVNSWLSIKKEFDQKYETAMAASSANEQRIKEIQGKEQRVAELRDRRSNVQSELIAFGDSISEYNALKEEWKTLHERKLKILSNQAVQLTVLSEGSVKADVSNSVDVESLKARMKLMTAGLNIREQKLDSLCKKVSSSTDLFNDWYNILTEIENLVLWNGASGVPMPATPILTGCDLIENERNRVATGVKLDKWLDLAVYELEFNPTFEYCTNKTNKEYIEFEKASAGQQATALLTILLNQNGPPLIIDQPEDDIDSKLVPEITQKIWSSKNKRQLLFTSHNANFVVNGDAELVVCCDYASQGDQTGGRIKFSGAIDKKEVREEITAVTEGGKTAFELRMKKYGY